MKDDYFLKIEAQMHLEYVTGLIGELPMKYEPSDGANYLEEFGARQQLERRVWAALYLVQALGAGSRPDNFDKVLDAARWYDAREWTKAAIEQAKS